MSKLTLFIQSVWFLQMEKTGFPDGSAVWNPPADAGDPGSIPGSGRSLVGGNGNPLQYSWLKNPIDRGDWWTTVHGSHKESDMTEHSTVIIQIRFG